MAIFESAGGAALIGGGLGLLGGLMRNDAASAQASSAQNFSAEQFATRYQTTVKDMQAAGLSPMLAYSQGGGSPPTGVAAQVENVGSAAAAGMASGSGMALAVKQQDLLRAQTANVEADTGLKESQARAADAAANSSAWESMSRQNLAQSQAQEIQNRLENNVHGASAARDFSSANLAGNQATEIANRIEGTGGSEGERQRFELVLRELASQAALNQQRGMSEVQSRAVMRQTIEKLKSETSVLDFSMPEREALHDFYSSDVGKASPYAKFMMDMGQGVSDILLPWKKFGASQRGGWSSTEHSGPGGHSVSTTEYGPR